MNSLGEAGKRGLSQFLQSVVMGLVFCDLDGYGSFLVRLFYLGGVYSFEQKNLLLAFSRCSNYENDCSFVAFADRLIDPRILYTMGSKNPNTIRF